jgi:hypothetical protein
MEQEVKEYIEGQPKKKRTEEEYIAWLQELSRDSKARRKENMEFFQQLKRDFPEAFK